MTKQHYKAIAEILRVVLRVNYSNNLNHTSSITNAKKGDLLHAMYNIKTIAEGLAYFFKSNNPRFNVLKFKEACEYPKMLEELENDGFRGKKLDKIDIKFMKEADFNWNAYWKKERGTK